jgi:hypothetical protein
MDGIENEIRDKVARLFPIIFFLAFTHACSLKKCFSRKIIISFSTAAMNATRALIWKLH